MIVPRRLSRENLTKMVIETEPTSQRKIVEDEKGRERYYYPEPLPGIAIEPGTHVFYGDKKWTFLGRTGADNDDALLFDGKSYLSLDHVIFRRSARLVSV